MLVQAQPAILADVELLVAPEPARPSLAFVRAAQKLGAVLDPPRAPELWVSAAAVGSAANQQASAESQFKLSGDIALVSDYRIAGVSSTGRKPALQGEIDVDAPHGWSGGVWASNIKEFAGARTEIDLYGSKTVDFGDTELALGATAIWLAGGQNIVVGLATASLSRPIGPVDATVSLRYAWRQARLDGADDFSVSASVKTPIGALAGVPLTLGASLGYEDGIFVSENTKTDWSLSLTANVRDVDIGVSYVDTDVRDPNAAPACLVTITRAF